MIFLIIVIAAIALYVWDYKIPAVLLFFFFITSGYNLFPEEMDKFGIISKGTDFAFFTLIGIVTIDFFCKKNYFKPDLLTKFLIVFGLFLVACIAQSKFVLGLSWVEILRTIRYQFFWLAYFIFRSMEKEQLEKLLRYLFDITVVLSVLFLLQIVFETRILSGMDCYHTDIFGITLPRFYNQPDMLHFFMVMAIYCNPHQGKWKVITTTILILAFLGAFHRNLYGLLGLILIIGYTFKLSHLRRIIFISALGVIGMGVFAIVGAQFMQSRTFSDLQSVKEGNFAEVSEMDMESFYQSTFTFRLAHLFERNQYVIEHPRTMLFGVGLLTEDSKMVNKLFDFQIGLVDNITQNTVQLDTADISYSPLIIQLGYLGTILYLTLFFYIMFFFYANKKKHPYAIFSFLFFLLTLGTSFFSISLIKPITYLMLLMSYVIIQKAKEQHE